MLGITIRAVAVWLAWLVISVNYAEIGLSIGREQAKGHQKRLVALMT